jgi:hypothetical protein
LASEAFQDANILFGPSAPLRLLGHEALHFYFVSNMSPVHWTGQHAPFSFRASSEQRESRFLHHAASNKIEAGRFRPGMDSEGTFEKDKRIELLKVHRRRAKRHH